MTTAENPSRAEVWKMFDRIAPRYDFLNRLLSMRRDVAWRKRLAELLPEGDGPGGEGLELLDLATGTGDQILHLMGRTDRIGRALGLDVSEGMLDVGRAKVARSPWADRIELALGDATELAQAEETFDVVTMSFGIRNVVDVPAAMREMRRVLRPGGRALILEFALPENALMRRLYLFYFRHVLPRIGGLVSGDAEAYKYLNQTVESFPHGEAFCQLLRGAGFGAARAVPLTFGIANIYVADK